MGMLIGRHRNRHTTNEVSGEVITDKAIIAPAPQVAEPADEKPSAKKKTKAAE